MMLVNIYVYQTIKGPRAKAGAYTYVLETELDGKERTLTASGHLEPMSENKAELTVVLKALQRLRKECDVNIFGASIHVKTGIETWIDKWIKADWKNAKGKEIANLTEWQQLLEFRNKYKITVSDQQENTFTRWMKSEAEKEERKAAENEARKRAETA